MALLHKYKSNGLCRASLGQAAETQAAAIVTDKAEKARLEQEEKCATEIERAKMKQDRYMTAAARRLSALEAESIVEFDRARVAAAKIIEDAAVAFRTSQQTASEHEAYDLAAVESIRQNDYEQADAAKQAMIKVCALTVLAFRVIVCFLHLKLTIVCTGKAAFDREEEKVAAAQAKVDEKMEAARARQSYKVEQMTLLNKQKSQNASNNSEREIRLIEKWRKDTLEDLEGRWGICITAAQKFKRDRQFEQCHQQADKRLADAKADHSNSLAELDDALETLKTECQAFVDAEFESGRAVSSRRSLTC
eukprot:SAG31_NODE_962_length_10731_cov_4.198552_11_plen_307_part_00